MPSFGNPGGNPAMLQPIMRFGLALCLVAAWFLPIPAHSAVPQRVISAQCDEAAATAARQSGVPIDVLLAVTRTETGRRSEGVLVPWPWTVNMEGAGRWFATEDEARAYVFQHFKRGARSFDVGCFQINYKWHQQGFSSIEEMFDPDSNALYAAQFLESLFAELGSWTDAVGAYHSRTPEYATRYLKRYTGILAALGEAPPPIRARAPSGSRGWADLFRNTDIGAGTTNGFRSPGSLVPLAQAGGAAFISLQQGDS